MNFKKEEFIKDFKYDLKFSGTPLICYGVTVGGGFPALKKVVGYELKGSLFKQCLKGVLQVRLLV